MKTLLAAFMLILVSDFTFAQEGTWTTSFEQNAPSCSLYRKRVANYYNRLLEFELANKILTGELLPKEIASLVELWRRTDVPLASSETATWSVEVTLTHSWTKKLQNSLERVNVTSPLITWESDKLLFPEDIMEMVVDAEKGVLKINVMMSFAFACLQKSKFLITFKNIDYGFLDLSFNLDKTQWDLIHR